MLPETDKQSEQSLRGGAAARPGLVLAFTGGTTLVKPVPLDAGPVLVGREGPFGESLRDDCVSRRHAEIERTPAGVRIRDLNSRNGTFVDGVAIFGEVVVRAPRVIRVGETILVPTDDFAGAAFVAQDGPVTGTRLRAAMAEVDRAAASSDTLLVLGESGTGKELAASRFHERGPNARGPFVAVNCAAIPDGLAERLLFGAKRGAFSGATSDAIGHVQAADFGVLFLDEAGELDLAVQAKLLRVLETREVVPLGASHGTRVATRIVMATHRDLRAAVADGRFRSDLYHRIAPPEVTLPPLRERLDEIPQHVAQAVEGVARSLRGHARLVEACLLRHWPGNVRELRKHVHDAASRALDEGAERVRLEHLAPSAGEPFRPSAPPGVAVADAGAVAKAERRGYVRWSESMTRDRLERALADHGGNVSLAARSIGMARSQFYRQMERFDLRRAPDGSAQRRDGTAS